MPGSPAVAYAGGLRLVEASRQKALEHSMGSVLIGSLIALFLSGAVWMQVFLYIQLYPRDRPKIKFMLRYCYKVFLVWLLDTLHSAMTITANWQSIATTVALTALITFFVHWFVSLSDAVFFNELMTQRSFFIHRIYTFSTSEMILLHSYSQFVSGYDVRPLTDASEPTHLTVTRGQYVFTIGLSTAASLDILIAGALCYFLRRGRSRFSGMDRIVDAITLYTIENGLLTCIATVVSLICWVSMPTNLIFLGLHFAISKLYANSLLATLNARKSLLNKSQGSTADGDHPLPILFPDSYQRRTNFRSNWSLEITVHKTVERDIDIEPNSAFPLAVPQASPPPTGSEADLEAVKSPQRSFLAE
ncbi:hypothetical protein BN946_scf184398.g2 [Trametes cinnabarina]|uniref:DUF6534 domain-containing protein n=1 Tax=Pycnoporus cinnabarinus TaxID=5643 RepID=A0A060SXF7_PYCCI|nr:hypothetical protein BN946_scf184398.g2 [Trametes cinnabarina]